MTCRKLVGSVLLGFCIPALAQQVQVQAKMVGDYCLGCHDSEQWKGGLALDSLDISTVGPNAEIWEKVVRKLRAGTMPPAGEPRPDRAGYDFLATYLETRLDQAAAAHPNPGRPSAVHRLNRAEYANAVRDLLGVRVNAESMLPADESAAGFDDNGETLSVSAMLMERYLIAARQISRTAVADPTIRPTMASFDAPPLALQAARESEDLPFGSRGGMAVKYEFPADGEYTIKLRLQRTKGIEGPRIIGLGLPHRLDVRVDGKRVKLLTIGGETDRSAEEVEKGLEVRFTAQAGYRAVGATFLDEQLAVEGMQRPRDAEFQLKGWGPRDDGMRQPGIESIAIGGPYNASRASDSPSRRKIFTCHPVEAGEQLRCARTIIARLTHLAYRRPVGAADVDPLIRYYETGRKSRKDARESFEEGVRMAVQAMLVSPDFLFRFERDEAGKGQPVHRISDLELASRLSFFLWSSIPDETLLTLAEGNTLHERTVLRQQVRRMLGDVRSQALVDNFFGQWLDLRSVKTHVVDSIELPEFDDDLREAFSKETDLLLASMLREDRSVLELLNGRYTFVNERLARFYEIPNVRGSQFRRVALTDEKRWGILGKGAVLMVTSLPNRTSPVLRGKWVLDNIIGSPPPPPPPTVPAFPEQETDFTKLSTVRQRLEQHRKDPNCASCHAQMDPLGFAFDNFDAIGKWRRAEPSPILFSPELPVFHIPIDASGVFLGGLSFKGPDELRAILMQRPANFVQVVTGKLLTYGLGRGLDYYDMPAVRKVVRDATPGEYRWVSIILGIVESEPFQMRAAAQDAPPPKPQTIAQVQAIPK